jgi:hypothetical protein
MHPRYRRATRPERTPLLTEFCRVTGSHRKYALRLLNGPPPSRTRPPRRRRAPTYGPRVLPVLAAIWTAAGYPWSVRLKALLPLWLPWARPRYRLTPALEQPRLALRPRPMDRRLQARQRQRPGRRDGRTKPGTLLQHHIPVKTDRWDVTVPGYTEIDLVAHGGDRGDGEFAHALNLTDIHTTWVETRAVLGRGQTGVRDALDEMRQVLPVALQGIDSDNGSEFINRHLYGYCQAHRIPCTRGRPYTKDDNAHIEQKNWTHVRKLLGYVRYASPEAVAAMNALYRSELRLFQNCFLPSVKLVKKVRVGSRVRRRYDRPQTPLERVAAGGGEPATVAALVALRDRLDPFQLAQTIDQQLDRISRLAQGGGRPESAPPPPAVGPPLPLPRPRVTSHMAR